MDELSGKRLDQYELYQVLGKGGMATVYRGRQTSIGRDVAVKILSPDLVGNQEFSARFEREARIIAGLQHPHILTVYDFGREGRIVYLVMRLMEGGSLATELAARGRMHPQRVLTLVRQIASALEYAHERGIVHRDLKPNNVLLDDDGNAYLTDFGIAKMVSSTTASGLTQPGSVMGTPSYMAPEQWRSEAVDGRTDIYALGVITYQMLAGQVPFASDTPHGLMYQHLDREATPVHMLNAQIPRVVDYVLARAMAKTPNTRYPNAIDFARDLEGALLAPERFGHTLRDAILRADQYDSFAERDLMSRAGDDDLDETVVPPDMPRRPSPGTGLPPRPAPGPDTLPPQPPHVTHPTMNQGSVNPPRGQSRPKPPPLPDQTGVYTGRQTGPGASPPMTPPGRTGHQRPPAGQQGRPPRETPPPRQAGELRTAGEPTSHNAIVGCLRSVITVILGLALFGAVMLVVMLALNVGKDSEPETPGGSLPAVPTVTAPPTLTAQPAVAPAVQITFPPDRTQVRVGAPVTLNFTAHGAGGVTRVEMRRLGRVLDARNYTGENTVQGTFTYTPDSTGFHILEVIAYNGSTASQTVSITLPAQIQ